MRVLSGIDGPGLKNSCVTLGKFDGVHLGHRKLIETLVGCEGLHPVVFTFDPLPGSPIRKLQPIYTDQEQEAVLAALGVEILIRYPFSAKEAAMEAEEFVRTVLIEWLDAKHIVIGRDFRFGHACKGDAALLGSLAEKYGFLLTVHDKVTFDEEEISSSRIRECIAKGDLRSADHMLGK